MSRPKGTDSAETRERILQCACGLLCDSSQPFGLRAVARRAEISVGTLQYHFADKKCLMDACVDTVYERFNELVPTFAERLSAAKSTEELLEYGVRLGFSYACENRPYVRVLEAGFVDQGRLDVSRHRKTLAPLLDTAGALLGAALPIDLNEVRLRINSVILLAGRYAIMDEDALADLFTPASDKTAQETVEDHLVSVAIALLAPAR